MTIRNALNDKEQDKFRESSSGGTAVAVVGVDTSDIVLIDTGTSGIIYSGVAAKASLTSAAAWQITKYDTSTSVISIKKSLPNQIWDSRSVVTYE